MTDKKHPIRLSLTMKNFSFWGKDTDQMKEKLVGLLKSGNFLTLEMNSSTSLTEDLYQLDRMMLHTSGSMDFGFQIQEQYSNKPPQLLVYLTPNMEESE